MNNNEFFNETSTGIHSTQPRQIVLTRRVIDGLSSAGFVILPVEEWARMKIRAGIKEGGKGDDGLWPRPKN